VKLLLDEDVPHPLARLLLGRDVRTVAGLGWGGVKNGELLKLIAAEGFEVFVTGDKNLQNQQTILNRPFAFVLLSTIHWPVLRKHVPAIAEAIEKAKPGTVTPVECGSFSPKRRPRNSQS
jgi:predicted nuclease of predicted toxin-antitoxin system